MPSSDYGSRAGTPGSNPASKSYAGSNYAGGVGGNKSNSLGKTGLTTSATMRGNTAFGPAGGKATGYATNTRLGSGLGPSIGSFSNFRNADGSAMFGGILQNRAIAARNPQQAMGMLRALQMAQGGQRPSSGRVGGLLDGEQVTVGPTVVRPVAATGIGGPWPGQSTLIDLTKKVVDPVGLDPYAAAVNQNHINGMMWMRNPTNFPQWATGWRQGYLKSRPPSMPPPTGEESIR